MSETTTSILARHAAALDFAGLPAAARSQVRHLFLNWVGCAPGVSAQPAVTTAPAAVFSGEFAGPAETSILGRSERAR